MMKVALESVRLGSRSLKLELIIINYQMSQRRCSEKALQGR